MKHLCMLLALTVFGCDPKSGEQTTETGSDTDSDTPGASTHWRIVNATSVDDHWNISEMTFFADNECQNSLAEAVTDILTVEISDNDCGEDTALEGTIGYDTDVLNDGDCTFEGGCEPGNWASDPTSSGARQIWVGYALNEPSLVGCITLCQSSEQEQRVTAIMLERSDDGGETWITVETITSETASTTVPTVFIRE